MSTVNNELTIDNICFALPEELSQTVNLSDEQRWLIRETLLNTCRLCKITNGLACKIDFRATTIDDDFYETDIAPNDRYVVGVPFMDIERFLLQTKELLNPDDYKFDCSRVLDLSLPELNEKSADLCGVWSKNELIYKLASAVTRAAVYDDAVFTQQLQEPLERKVKIVKLSVTTALIALIFKTSSYAAQVLPWQLRALASVLCGVYFYRHFPAESYVLTGAYQNDLIDDEIDRLLLENDNEIFSEAKDQRAARKLVHDIVEDEMASRVMRLMREQGGIAGRIHAIFTRFTRWYCK